MYKLKPDPDENAHQGHRNILNDLVFPGTSLGGKGEQL